MDEEQIGPRFKAKDIEGIDPLYTEEKLNFDNIKKNPILKPIAEINKIYTTFELVVIKALWEYEAEQKKINEMVIANPKYSETMLMARVLNLQNSVKQIIHSQDIQKENMKKTIKEMIDIVNKEYGLLEEEESSKEIESKEEETEEEEKIKKEEPLEKEEKSEKFYSDLIEKEIPKPKDIEKKE